MSELETEDSNSLPSSPESIPQDAEFQLSKLSSVINGLNRGATVIRSHINAASGAVQAGTYSVDPLRVSERIVRDCLWENDSYLVPTS